MKEVSFPLFIDQDIGISGQYTDCLTEARQDDDVDTDEEVYDTAIKACSRDFNQTQNALDCKPPNQFLKNCDIKKRV